MLNFKKNKEENIQNSLVAKGFSLSALTLASRILGLVREMTKSRFLGTSAFSDAFSIAFMVPNLFRRLFAENSISVAFIPTFKAHLEESSPGSRQKTQDFINATFTLVLFLTSAFVAAGIFFTPAILRIFYADENSMNEAVILTRIMFPYLLVISVAAFFQGILNGQKIFAPSGFTPVLFNITVIIFTLVLSRFTANPARAMAIGVISGGTIQALFQLPFVLKNGWTVAPVNLKRAFSNEGSKKVFALIGPTIIGMAGYQINDIVSSALAARSGEGIVSSLQYSLRLQELILGICAVTIGTVILPDLTGFAKKNLWEKFNSLLTQSIKIMALIAIPVTFYSLIMGENIITLVFAGGKFNAESIRMTADVFHIHIAGLFFIAVNRIVSPAFYAQQNSKSPTAAGLINFAVNILLASVLSVKFKGKGIAFALTVASAVNTLMLFIFLRKTKTIDVGNIVKSAIFYSLKIALFSIAASVPVLLIKNPAVEFFSGRHRLFSQGIPVMITAAVFGAAGILMLSFSKDSLFKTFSEKILGKFKKGGKEK
ncbi:murein biosynthesis integral membrane protein MurJ [Treponema sp.]|uniref:murein biosynthesis integral membrane protein MurJ n=1 Tax=Treponema sp. TaxID=166 RepID=UPI003F09BDCD